MRTEIGIWTAQAVEENSFMRGISCIKELFLVLNKTPGLYYYHMLICFDSNRRICLIMCVIFLLVVSSVFTIGAVLQGEALERSEESILTIYVDVVMGPSKGEAMAYICADSSLYEISGGGAVGIIMTLELSSGWAFGEAVLPKEFPDETEGMTVTARADEYGDTLNILLDGTPPATDEKDEVRLVKVNLKSLADVTSLSIGLSVKGGIYYTRGNGEICTQPVKVMGYIPDPVGTEDSDENLQESTGEEDDSTATIETMIPQVSDSVSEHDTERETCIETNVEDEPPVPFVYVGCQETPVTEGEYSVRLLFFGDLPAVLVEGGGYLTVEIENTHLVEAYVGGETRRYQGDWLLCTFHGLREDREYTFSIPSAQGEVNISYRDGRFRGYEERIP